MIEIGKYKIVKDDERNLKLTKTVIKQKGDNAGEEGESFIGYFGYLDQALNKIINCEVIEALGDSETITEAKDLRDVVRSTYEEITASYHTYVRDIA